MIKKLVVGDLQENCYIIQNDNDCVIIDAGDDYEQIKNYITEHNLNILGILLTHGHFDHCAACYKFQQEGVKIYIHNLDADKLYTDGNLASLINKNFDKFKPDVLLEQGNLNLGQFEFYVIHTPGHSQGGVSYVYKNNVFCGDTLFENGVGRYDFYDGSLEKLKESIEILMQYKYKGYKFYYGH
ncbi:MAG: MBL fold metallo-hydrolase [Clostridia bacterium]|nr:MBL fold metallo-hydrolase [Clostridia bacterium]